MGWQKGWERAGALMCVVSFCVGIASARTKSVQPAVVVVARFQQTLLSVMKEAHQLGFKGRYRMLAPAVDASHNLKYIAEVTVGPYWQHLSAKSRKDFVHTFTELTVATYAAQFDGYSGETFQETQAHIVGPGDVLVETTLTAHDHKEAVLDYLLAPSGSHWKIVNIVANGVSDLALKRAQYISIIRAKGFPALLATLRAKVVQLSKTSKAG